MKRVLLLCCVLVNYVMYSQLDWHVPNTGENATISIGEGNGATGASDPTLDDGVLPAGSLIGVFFVNNNNFRWYFVKKTMSMANNFQTEVSFATAGRTY